MRWSRRNLLGWSCAPQTISREVSASKKKQKRVDFTGWKEENLQLYPWLVKKPCSDSVWGFKLYWKHCLDYPDKVHKGSSLGYKGFSGTENGFKTETFNRHLEEGGHKRIIEDLEKKKGNVQVVGPMDSFTNQLTPELRASEGEIRCLQSCLRQRPANEHLSSYSA